LNREIRTGAYRDLGAAAALESMCFPPAEAASPSALAERLKVFPDCFWMLWEGGQLLSFADGLCTNLPDLTDEMYANPSMHRPDGQWLMILGLSTRPDCRRQGLASCVLLRAMADARQRGQHGLVLTCKETLIPFYSHLGFVAEGLSASDHGGAAWYQMRLIFR